ncbi:MAG: hypothetical protein ABF289_20145 [Clostridiales bacterium]
MLATIPADITQYFAHVIRVIQKLIYLYGWDELNDKDELNDEMIYKITLFMGVMFGVSSANQTIASMSKVIMKNVVNKLPQKALTKGTIYPIVKKVTQIIGVKMTKQIFAKSVGKVIPIVGGLVSGGLTYSAFKPSAKKLKKYLEELPLADASFYEKKEKIHI